MEKSEAKAPGSSTNISLESVRKKGVSEKNLMAMDPHFAGNRQMSYYGK